MLKINDIIDSYILNDQSRPPKGAATPAD